MTKKLSMNLAVREFLATGKPLTELEAIVLFGAPHLPDLISKIRKEGDVVESQKISYSAVVRRINDFAVLTPPPNLPVRDLYFTEWWVSR
jgi:hypothetical protein